MKEQTKKILRLALQGVQSVKFIYKMSPWLMLAMMLIAIVGPVITYVIVSNTASIMNQIQKDPTGSVLLPLVTVCLMIGVDNFVSIIRRNIRARFFTKYKKDFYQFRNKKRSEMDIGTLKSKTYKDMVQKIVDSPYGWNAVRESVIMAFDAVGIIGSFAISIYVLGTIDWKIALILVCFVVPEFICDVYFSKKYWKMLDRLMPDYKLRDEFMSFFNGPVAMIETKLLGSSGHTFRQIEGIWNGANRQIIKFENLKTMVYMITAVLSVSGFGYVIFSIVRSTQAGLLELGTMSLAIAYVGTLKGSTSTLLSNLSNQFEINRYVKLVFDVFNLKPSISGGIVSLPKDKSPTIKFEDVWFHYPDKEGEWVLKNINLELKAGDRIGIFGENGAGKSSLLALLCRVYDPVKGRITVDGMDLKEIAPELWQDYLSVLNQRNNTYSLLIGDSIRIGDSEKSISDEEILSGAVFANAKSVIEKHGGLSAQLGTEFGGVELSGGEEKRLAILRRMIRERKVLIFDEPEKELSSKSCDTFFQQLSDLPDEILAIYVSHNIATLRLARKILVMDEGEIKYSGTHQELKESENPYRTAFESQVRTLFGELKGLGFETPTGPAELSAA